MDDYQSIESVTAFLKRMQEDKAKQAVKPFNDLATAKRIISSKLSAKFVGPPQHIMWETKIKDCLMVCKILKTLCATFDQKMYHYIYKSSFFCKPTTFVIRYNSTSYTFEVTTGINFKNRRTEIKNSNIDELYKATEELLPRLLKQMKNDLPSGVYDGILFRYEILKELRTY